VGVILSTALLASAPLLVNTVVEFGLRRTILSANAEETNLRLVVNGFIAADPADYVALDAQIQALAAAHIGEHLVRTIPTARIRATTPRNCPGRAARSKSRTAAIGRTGSTGTTPASITPTITWARSSRS